MKSFRSILNYCLGLPVFSLVHISSFYAMHLKKAQKKILTLFHKVLKTYMIFIFFLQELADYTIYGSRSCNKAAVYVG